MSGVGWRTYSGGVYAGGEEDCVVCIRSGPKRGVSGLAIYKLCRGGQFGRARLGVDSLWSIKLPLFLG